MITIVVPYRDRAGHLAGFLPWMAEYLQDVEHRIVIVEQDVGRPFNRGKLANIGFECFEDCDLFVIHDVDMLPLDADYTTPPEKPACLVAIGPEKHHTRPDYFGGVTLLTPDQYRAINGFSNGYWGWGCEDQDMRMRCINTGLGWMRRPGEYEYLPHPSNARRVVFEKNRRVLDRAITLKDFRDGLATLEYEVLDEQYFPDHIRLLVSI